MLIRLCRRYYFALPQPVNWYSGYLRNGWVYSSCSWTVACHNGIYQTGRNEELHSNRSKSMVSYNLQNSDKMDCNETTIPRLPWEVGICHHAEDPNKLHNFNLKRWIQLALNPWLTVGKAFEMADFLWLFECILGLKFKFHTLQYRYTKPSAYVTSRLQLLNILC